MLPIHKLLARIRRDRRFGSGRFELGYFDRIERRIVVVPFESVHFPMDAPGAFEIVDEAGEVHLIPFHRVRRVWRDGRIIWERHPPGEVVSGSPSPAVPRPLRTGRSAARRR